MKPIKGYRKSDLKSCESVLSKKMSQTADKVNDANFTKNKINFLFSCLWCFGFFSNSKLETYQPSKIGD